MYQEFYGLKQKPFSLTPDPEFLYLSGCHRTAIESLLYGIAQKEGFMVVTGDIGTGKTTICRTLLEKLDKNVKTAVIFNSFLTEKQLLESILHEFSIPFLGKTRKEKIDALNELLIRLLAERRNAVLIIDEAQNLSVPVLEQIRMLSNLETEKEKMLQIILFGQLELDQKLQSKELRQLNQRIAIRHQLTPLTRAETESYVYQRLTVAGAQGGVLFSKPAFDEVYRFSKGTPRLINLLSDRALLGGFVDQTCHIDQGLIERAKKSLLGQEAGPAAHSKPWSFLRGHLPLRHVLLLVLLSLLAGAILFNQEMTDFIRDRIQNIFLQIPRTTVSSARTDPFNTKTTAFRVLTSGPPSPSPLPPGGEGWSERFSR